MSGPDAGRQVVLLASVDWDSAWQRHHAWAEAFAGRGAEVFFVENTGFRDLRLRDLGRARSRFARLFAPRAPSAAPVPAGVRVLSPLVLPPTSTVFRALNAAFFVPRLVGCLRARGLRPGATVMAYLPTATTLMLLDRLEPGTVVYDCVDNFEGHPTPPHDLKATEAALFARAALVLTTARTLYDRASSRHPNVHLLHHGVSEAFFSAPRPRGPLRRLCYFGTVWGALDYRAVAALAEAGFEVTLAGPVKEPPPPLPPRVSLHQAMPHAELPSFLAGFDALLLPYADTPYNAGVVPAKLFECLATGKPVLASALPSLADYKDLLYLASRPEDFPALARRAAEEDGADASARRIAAARGRTTAAQAQEVARLMSAAPRADSAPLAARAAPETSVGWALCAFACALPLTIAGANIGWGLVAAALAWRLYQGTPPRWRAAKGPLWTPLWVFMGATLAADAFGVDPLHSLRFLHQDAHKLWLAALFSVALSEELPTALPLTLGAGFAAAAAIGLGQFGVAWALGIPGWAHVRAHAFVHPVTYGEQMALGALGAISALLCPPEGAAGAGSRRKIVGLLIAIGSALLLSNTRAATAAFAVGAVGALWAVSRRRMAGLAAAAAGVVFISMEVLRQDRSVLLAAASYLHGGHQPAGFALERFVLWRVAWRMGLDHPLTGVGVNNYRAVLPRYYTGVFEDLSTSWGTAHDLYLHHFAERGLVGVAALALLLWVLTRRAWVRARRAPTFWTLWGLASTLAFLVMNVTEVALQTEMVWMLLFFIWLAAEADAVRTGA